MSPRTRLFAWIATALAALASPLWLLLLGETTTVDGLLRVERSWPVYVACVWSWLALSALWWLLATTPVNAINLPRGRSRALLILGAGWLVFAVLLASTLEPSSAPRAGVKPILAGLMTALFALGFVAIRHIGIWIAQQQGRALAPAQSPWWLALALWHPAFWLAAIPNVLNGINISIFIAESVAGATALWLVKLAPRALEAKREGQARRQVTVLALWIASLGLTLASFASLAA